MRQAMPVERWEESGWIKAIDWDLNSRHEMTPLLVGLQQLFLDPGRREQALAWIAKDVLGAARGDRGAPGMSYWEILVLAVVRHGGGWDYDTLADLADNHARLRQVLGVADDPEQRFPRSTIHDNVSKISLETIEAISGLMVEIGHQWVPNAVEQVRTDGWVVQTNIHFPTDANLVVDGLEKITTLAARLAQGAALSGWRQWQHLCDKARQWLRSIARLRRRGKQDPHGVQQAYQALLQHAHKMQQRAWQTLRQIGAQPALEDLQALRAQQKRVDELVRMLHRTEYVCQLARRRVLEGEVIPHEDKIFSLFEIHTDLIVRGKQNTALELGRRVVVSQDQAGFILNARVLERGELEVDVTVPIIQALQHRFDSKIQVASFDQGFYTPDNLKDLQQLVTTVAMKKRGYRNASERERQNAPAFRRSRRWHAGIESCIHALQSTQGLDRCPDRGEVHFHRYVAWGVLGHNCQLLGELILEQQRQSLRRAA